MLPRVAAQVRGVFLRASLTLLRAPSLASILSQARSLSRIRFETSAGSAADSVVVIRQINRDLFMIVWSLNSVLNSTRKIKGQKGPATVSSVRCRRTH